MNNSKEYNELVKISEILHQEYLQEDKIWYKSPFEWIKHRPSRAIGTIGEKMVSMWLTSYDFNVLRSPDTEADRIIENKRVEIKFSTLWKNGLYVFQQIRNQNYDFIIMLGVSPNDAHCWVINKIDIMKLWKDEHIIKGQHTGEDGEDTAWLHVHLNNIERFSKYGGELNKAIKLISDYTGFYPKTFKEQFD